MFRRTASPDIERRALSFPKWNESLADAALDAAVREQYRWAILTFLKLCKSRRAPATVALVREHLADARTAPGAREALRWFFREGRKAERRASAPPLKPGVEVEGTDGAPSGRALPRNKADDGARGSAEQPLGELGALSPSKRQNALPVGYQARPTTVGARLTESGVKPDPQSEPHLAGRRATVPSLAASDLGGADWERDLIKATREAGMLWRTEETYRGWAARFARFIAPRSPYAAEAKDVGEFLSALAVEQRAAPSTQKQALNAIVFLMQTALSRELGKLDFQRPRARERVPTVLSQPECVRIFSQMEGMTRLMAELMYGSGLRLMELLRLRVHHLDLERGRLQVRGGKGDRVYGFADAALLA